jgi:hypothetical protein
MHQVDIVKERPDFRVFIDLLFGPGRNVDTEGDSSPVNSRTWSCLFIKDRENNSPHVEIERVDDRLFQVDSASTDFEELVALYLFLFCGKNIKANGELLNEIQIELLKEKYERHLQRAESSTWHHSSDINPYPP